MCYFVVVKLSIIYQIQKNMTANEALDNYFSSLSSKERIAKSRDIREFCGKSRSVLSDWRRGRSAITPECQVKITAVLGKNIFANIES